MDALSLAQPYKGLFPAPRFNRRTTMHNPASSFIRSVLIDNNKLDSSSSKTSYKDNWFDRLAINHLSQSLQSATGLKSVRSGYDGLVEAAAMASRQFDPIKQRQLVIQTLQTAFPSAILLLIKSVMPPTKFSREYFAIFTTIFFAWLVGPCEVKESEFEGRRERNVVHVPKCRFLEETNCVGMCTNLCKMPSQTFIKDSLGMPINMVPNFEDMSCEMRFGEEAPPESLDPAFSQPCYKQCKSARRQHRNCAAQANGIGINKNI